MPYHVGAYKRGSTLVIQATPNKDALNCELIAYFGCREVTKEHIRRNRYALLTNLRKEMPHKYGQFVAVVVE